MVDVWVFGRLIATLASAFAVVLVIVALTSITYLATTLAPALRMNDPRVDRLAKRLGVSFSVGTFALALLGLRVGAPGAGWELIPTLAVGVATAAAVGASAAFAALGTSRARALLAAARSRRSAELQGKCEEQTRRVGEARRAFLQADDLRAQLAQATAAVARLSAALTNLAATRAEVDARLSRIDAADAQGDLARELRRTRDEVATKLELGAKILHAARAAAFRIAVSAPLTRLLRQRPRQVAAGLSAAGAEAGAVPRELTAIGEALDAFLARAQMARAELEEIEAQRGNERATRREEPAGGNEPSGGDEPAGDDDPLAQAKRDVDAVEAAYRAVRERLDVVRMRFAARADLDAVASAAGEVSEKARASGLPAGDLQELVAEVMRAESAIVLATPAELDARALTATLARGTAALGGHDGASLDELLRALREIA